LNRYVEAIPLPSIAVFVDVPPEECWARLQKRLEPPIPLQKRGSPEAIGQLTMGRRCLESLAALSEQRNVKVFRIANGLEETITTEDRLHDVLDYLGTSKTH
jgi:thymidylate kinase